MLLLFLKQFLYDQSLFGEPRLKARLHSKGWDGLHSCGSTYQADRFSIHGNFSMFKIQLWKRIKVSKFPELCCCMKTNTFHQMLEQSITFFLRYEIRTPFQHWLSIYWYFVQRWYLFEFEPIFGYWQIKQFLQNNLTTIDRSTWIFSSSDLYFLLNDHHSMEMCLQYSLWSSSYVVSFVFLRCLMIETSFHLTGVPNEWSNFFIYGRWDQ